LNKDVNINPSADGADPSRRAHEGKEKNRSRRWSAADTAVAVLILLAVVGIVGRLVFFGGSDVKDYMGDGVVYSVEYTVDEIYEATANSIKAMDTVSLLETGDAIGYIAPYADYTPVIEKIYIDGEDFSDGEYLKVSLRGIIFCNNAVMRDGCLFVADGGKYIAPGSHLTLATETALLDVKVVSINVAS